MGNYALKPKFQNLLRPLVRSLYVRGVAANQVTLFSRAVSVLPAGAALCVYADTPPHVQHEAGVFLFAVFHYGRGGCL